MTILASPITTALPTAAAVIAPAVTAPAVALPTATAALAGSASLSRASLVFAGLKSGLQSGLRYGGVYLPRAASVICGAGDRMLSLRGLFLSSLVGASIDWAIYGTEHYDFVTENVKNAFKSGVDTTAKRVVAELTTDESLETFFGAAGKTANKVMRVLEDNADTLDFGTVTGKIGKTNLDKFAKQLDIEKLAKDASEKLTKISKEAVDDVLGGTMETVSKIALTHLALGIATLIGLPLSIHYGYLRLKHSIGKPQLASEMHEAGFFSPFTDAVRTVFGWVEPTVTPVFEADVTRQMNNCLRAFQHVRLHSGDKTFFPNLLLYGAPGVGKTSIAKYIAEKGGMNYILMSGSDLKAWYGTDQHAAQLTELLLRAKNGSLLSKFCPWMVRPTLLVIDECETFCRDREKMENSKDQELLNVLLKHTGNPSNKLVLVLATNAKPSDLDPAILSRCDHILQIPLPGLEERCAIIKNHLPHVFSTKEENFFTPHQIAHMAELTEGLSGRSLQKILNAIAVKQMTTEEHQITQEIVNEVIRDAVRQSEKIKKR